MMGYREFLYFERLKLTDFVTRNQHIKQDTILFLKYDKNKQSIIKQIKDLDERFQIYESNLNRYKNRIYNIDFEHKNLETETWIAAKNKYQELMDDLKFYDKKISTLNFNLNLYNQITIWENDIHRLTKEIDNEENSLF
jgi:hypothetical protein